MAHSFQVGFFNHIFLAGGIKSLFSQWACHQSDNSQIKSVLQTVLITHNGFAGCPSHSILSQINGITSFSRRNMEAIKERGEGDLATIQNHPYARNGGEIEINMRVCITDSLLIFAAFSSHKKWHSKTRTQAERFAGVKDWFTMMRLSCSRGRNVWVVRLSHSFEELERGVAFNQIRMGFEICL